MMKRIATLLFWFFLFSCEEVIDVALTSTAPILVVDARITYHEENSVPTTQGQVVLTLSGPFFEDEVPPAENAQVRIINENTNEIFDLVESNTGVFDDGFPNVALGIDYTLEVIYENEVYRATGQLAKSGTLTHIEQADGFLFDEDNETEIIITFDDVRHERNHYLVDLGFDNYLVTDDEYYQNSTLTFSYFYEDISPETVLTVQLLGINQQFANYFDQILDQSGQDAGGPFQVPASTVRGNVINETNLENHPLGYFFISEVDTISITTQ